MLHNMTFFSKITFPRTILAKNERGTLKKLLPRTKIAKNERGTPNVAPKTALTYKPE